jgi:hypothetical protein
MKISARKLIWNSHIEIWLHKRTTSNWAPKALFWGFRPFPIVSNHLKPSKVERKKVWKLPLELPLTSPTCLCTLTETLTKYLYTTKTLISNFSLFAYSYSFYLPHMEYEGSIGLLSRKMKIFFCLFSFFRTFYDLITWFEQ